MKKIILSSLLALGLLASCGGESSTPVASGSKAPSTSKTGGTSSEKHVHTFDETKWEHNETQHWHPATCEHSTQKGSAAAHTLVDVAAETKEATCAEEGKRVQVCSVCGEKIETTLPKTGHTWGTESAEAGRAEGKVGYKTRECTVCHAKDLFINAADENSTITGKLKSATDGTVKLNANGDKIEYVVAIPSAMTNVTVAINGWVDYFKDGNNNNESKTFFSRKSGEGPNVEVKLGETVVEITNTKTYEEMGMASRETGTDSTFALCELGTVASIAAGDLTITYTRLESYNLNIDSIHLITK